MFQGLIYAYVQLYIPNEHLKSDSILLSNGAKCSDIIHIGNFMTALLIN